MITCRAVLVYLTQPEVQMALQGILAMMTDTLVSTAISGYYIRRSVRITVIGPVRNSHRLLWNMSISNLFILLALAIILGPCLARNTPVLFEEHFDDCPCNLTLGGRAHRPSDVYYEVEKVGDQSKQSKRKCSRHPIGPPVSDKLKVQDFCPKPFHLKGKGSYILRACLVHNHVDARMELFEVRRSNNHLCEADISNDEIQAEHKRDCDSFCSMQCPAVGGSAETKSKISPEMSTSAIGTASRLIRGKIVPRKDKLAYVAWVGHTDRKNPSLRYSCTGSLIGAKWVLTAGHCNNEPGDVVYLGRRWHESTGQLKDFGDAYIVINVYRPKDFQLFQDPCDPNIIGVHNHDIALLELEQEVNNAMDIAIHLNTDCNFPYDCTHLRVTGHGRTCSSADGGTFTHTLKTTVVKAIDLSTCNRLLKDANLTLAVHELRNEEHICALHDECGSGLCSGDSGGPLTMRRRKIDHGGTLPVQVGVATWHVNECGRKGRPDVFEPVAEYAEWIHNTTGGAAKMYPPYKQGRKQCLFSYDGPRLGSHPRNNYSLDCSSELGLSVTGGEEVFCVWENGVCVPIPTPHKRFG